MFNFTTICESVRRRWIPIAVIAALCLCAGVVSSFVGKNGEVSIAPTYTAESTLYVTGYGYDEESRVGSDYNYTFSEGYMIQDVRRIVVSDSVAGEVRRQLGEDVTLATAEWIDKETKDDMGGRFVYVAATAPSSDTALKAADMAAEMTVDMALEEEVPLSSIKVAESAYLKTSDAAVAADLGTDDFASEKADAAEVASGISVKSVVIYAFVGLAGSIFVFAAYDILSRKIRSAKDVERLIDVPVIASVKAGSGDFASLSDSVKALLARNGLATFSVAAPTASDAADAISAGMAPYFDAAPATVALASEPDAVSSLLKSDAVLLVFKEGCAKGSEIESALNRLKVAGVPVLGAVFVAKKGR